LGQTPWLVAYPPQPNPSLDLTHNTDLPPNPHRVADAPALGCAILAAVAAGLHPDIPTAVAAMVRVARTVEPDPARHAVYAELYRERYSKLYPALKPLFHAAAAAGAAGANTSSQPAAAAGSSKAARSAPQHDIVPRAIVAASILAADFASLGDEVQRVLSAGADAIHIDMFDGSDISGGNFTIGPPVVAAMRRRFPSAFFDCHIAVQVRFNC